MYIPCNIKSEVFILCFRTFPEIKSWVLVFALSCKNVMHSVSLYLPIENTMYCTNVAKTSQIQAWHDILAVNSIWLAYFCCA